MAPPAVREREMEEKIDSRGVKRSFFFYLSSGYSCSICSYTDTHLHHTHAHLTSIQPDIQLYTDIKTRP